MNARRSTCRVVPPGVRRNRVLWAAALVFGAACGNRDQGPVAGEDYLDMQASNIMTGVEHYLTAEGIRRALLVADTAYVFEDSSRIEFRVVHLTLFEEIGTEAAELTAATGDLDTRTNEMVARGNVVLVTADGQRRIETEELHYSPREDRVWSDVATMLTENGDTLRGAGFTATGQLRNLKMREPRGQVPGVKIEF